jgi:hypothetical protein
MMGVRLILASVAAAHTPTTLRPAPLLSAVDLSTVREALESIEGASGAHLRRTDKVTTNQTEEANQNATETSSEGAKPAGWVPPNWYDNVPDLHKQMNENTALHDIYELGRTRTSTTTLWSISTTEPDWLYSISPEDVTWDHVIRKIDELRGFSVPKTEYVIPDTEGESDESEPGMEYGDSDDTSGRSTEHTDYTAQEGSEHNTLPPTRDRSNPGETAASTTEEPEAATTTDFTTGYSAFDMLDDLIKKTEGAPVSQTPPPPTPPPPFVGWGDHHWQKHTTTTTSTTTTPFVPTAPPVHHLHVPSTREPVTIVASNHTTTGSTTPDANLLTLEGIERVLYLLDKLVSKTTDSK